MKLDLDDLMDFAVRTATEAGRITLNYFGSAEVRLKGDGSEVTVADTESEEFIRRAIADAFPDHGIIGEEGAPVVSDGAYRWIVDPIDGTRSFAAGVPLYGVLLALEHDGNAILGCCHLPAIGETVVAAIGAGCWHGDRRAAVSGCDRLEDARVVTSGLEYWRDWATPAANSGFEKLIGRSRFGRTWGDSFGYVLVATGRAEILADPACGAHWDYAPMVPILAESGGRYTTLRGRGVSPWSSALASNARLHPEAVACWDDVPGDDELQTAAIRSRRGR